MRKEERKEEREGKKKKKGEGEEDERRQAGWRRAGRNLVECRVERCMVRKKEEGYIYITYISNGGVQSGAVHGTSFRGRSGCTLKGSLI